MAFCTNCGGQLGDQVAFCGNCGRPVGASAPAPPVIEPLDYTIQGDNLQVARVRLKSGQEVYAEAGKMVYKTGNVAWETRMSGNTLGEKLLGALRRTVTGESLFLTYFRANGPGEVGFAGNYPGRIQAFDLADGQSIMAQRDAFLFAVVCCYSRTGCMGASISAQRTDKRWFGIMIPSRKIRPAGRVNEMPMDTPSGTVR